MTVNVDDRKPVSEMVDELWGVYIAGPLEWEFADKGVTLMTGVKKI